MFLSRSRPVLSWLFAMAVLTINYGCSPQQANADPEVTETPITTATETPIKPFDVETAKKQFQGKPLVVLDISERSKDGKNQLTVLLSVPLDPAVNHQDYFSVADDRKQAVDGAWVMDDDAKTLRFSHTQPNTTYTVQIDPGLTAVSGAVLAEKVEQSLTTRDMKPMVTFDTNGSFLTKGLSRGIPVMAVNVDQINIDYFRIDPNNLSTFLAQMSRSYRHYYANQGAALGELVYSGRYAFDAEENTQVRRVIEIRDIEPLQKSGVYMAVLSKAGEYGRTRVLWFVVSDLGIHTREYKSELSVVISSLSAGTALQDVEVSLYDKQQNLIESQNTDAKGLASFLGSGKRGHLMVARKGEHFSILQMKKPALDLTEFELGKRPQLPVEVFVYGPRDLYRPGERADFNLLVRDNDGRKTQSAVLRAQLRKPDGTIGPAFNWTPDHSGYFHYQWQIPTDAPVGNWSLELSGPLQQPKVYPFKVEEFLPQRMKLTFAEGQGGTKVFKADQSVEVPVLGEYLYGAPGAGNRLATTVDVSHWRNPVEKLKQYQFGHITDPIAQNRFELDDLKLDTHGKATIKVGSRWAKIRSPLRVRLTGALYESGGRPVTRSHSVLVWPSESLLGIRSRYTPADDFDGAPQNSLVKFDIVNATVDGQLLAADNLEVRLVKQDRQYFWTHTSRRGWHYQWNEKEYIEASQTVSINQDTHASVSFPVNYGQYRLEVRDLQNNRVSSVSFRAGRDWYLDWRRANQGQNGAKPDRVVIAWDKPGYKAGDIAVATVVAPDAGQALLMVEGDYPLWSQRIEVGKDPVQVEIPVDESWQSHNLYLTAMVLRPGDGKASIAPNRSFGLSHLKLMRKDRKLFVNLDVADKLLPEQKVAVKVQVNDEQGDPVTGKAKLTLAAVDEGALAVSNFKTPDPHEFFFGQRAYNTQLRDIYDQIIAPVDAEAARLRFGGDADVGRGGKKPVSDVQIVSLFTPAVNLVNGQGEVELDIPQFNGQLRLMALAFDDNRVGHSDRQVTVAAPIVTQLSMPRFLANGDTAQVLLEFNNLTEQPQDLSLSFVAVGPVELEGRHETVKLAAKQRKAIKFRMKGTGFEGSAQLFLTVKGIKADGQTAKLERQWSIGLRPAYPAVTKTYRAVLSNGEVFGVDPLAIRGLLPQTVTGTFSVDNKANLDLSGQFSQLLQYPYGCLEQTGSRTWALAHANDEAQRVMGIGAMSFEDRQKRFDKGIERLQSLQLSNGGFGLWSNRSAEEHWLTAYTGELLLQARQEGFEIPQRLASQTFFRLKKYLNQSGRMVDERYSTSPDHYHIAYKAYAGYVLASMNQAPLGKLRRLYDRFLDKAETGLPKIHLGVALVSMGDRQKGLKAIEQGMEMLENSTGYSSYYGDYGSLLRDRAMAIHVLLTHKLMAQKALALSGQLNDMLRDKSWLSTQERNALFMAGVALSAGTSQQWSVIWMKDSTERVENSPTMVSQRLDAGAIGEGFKVRSTHSNPLFVNAVVTGHSETAPSPESNGLSVKRTWYDLKGKVIEPEQVSVGDLIVVQLAVNADKRVPDGLAVDLLPAGFELENQNLAHSVKMDGIKIDGTPIRELTQMNQTRHVEYRDDRFIAAIDVGKYHQTSLFYLMRAVTPGTYTVPATLVEDMYAPRTRAIGASRGAIAIINVGSDSE